VSGEGATVLTVSQCNARVKAVVAADPILGDLTVRGELSNFKVYSSGHCYFTLKDGGGELRCVMFRGAASGLRFHPADGMAVRASGRIDVYEKRGEYQLYVERLVHDGAGALFEAFERLKAQLAAEGLFDESRKRRWPLLPKRVAIITSPTGAAVRDMVRLLRGRWPGVRILIVPATVQGEQAAASLVRGLELANAQSDVELILFGRGGGSIEDLWAFNEEPVVRAVAASRVPVISCVGHETDTTICDFAADARAATPSHAAQMAVPDAVELDAALATLDRRLLNLLARRVESARSRFEALAERRVLRQPQWLVDSRAQAVDELSARLGRATAARARHAAARLEGLSQTLDALDPTRVLRRGYAILMRESGDSVVQSPSDLPRGEAATALLAGGRLRLISDGER
jgi:exodeoxyribonuclease VII large subunit